MLHSSKYCVAARLIKITTKLKLFPYKAAFTGPSLYYYFFAIDDGKRKFLTEVGCNDEPTFGSDVLMTFQVQRVLMAEHQNY